MDDTGADAICDREGDDEPASSLELEVLGAFSLFPDNRQLGGLQGRAQRLPVRPTVRLVRADEPAG